MARITTVNPAASLTANKVPYAVAGGRLADSGITFDPAANGNITLVPNGTGRVEVSQGANPASLSLNGSTSTSRQLQWRTSGVMRWGVAATTAAEVGGNAGSNLAIANYSDAGSFIGNVVSFIRSSGNALFGTDTDSSNGKIQLATHTTSAGGIGFGSDASWYRSAAGVMSLAASSGPGIQLVENGNARGQFSVSGGAVYFGTLSTQDVIIRTNQTTALTINGTTQVVTFAQSPNFATGVQVNGFTRINTTRPAWTVTATGANREFAASGATLAETAAELSQLMQDLKDIGILA